ncbi:Peptidase S33 tripeptidyl aminopeptidase-like protein [Teratosphaeria destructans]|uniref:Peptidase S33 tripeptidyl aminopeptidase-like protein n=1 Tax=Teratosphaeria destructans TaxID=418781 RepID=A0A9W7SXC3_9PEZI|nr:Peptidase S33 tripeptidyl aminopeptidase-like protein [Teratosphaeria destructans]
MAIVRLPAQVPIDDERYGGPILYNPGGPGNSGTDAGLSGGQNLQTLYDAAYSYNSSTYVSANPSAKYFDLIFFDNRGISNSTPYYACTESPTQLRLKEYELDYLKLEWPQENLDYLWQSGVSRYRGCTWDPVTNPKGSKIAKFASTAMVARDIVELVERHGEWREKQARILQQNGTNGNGATDDRLRWVKGEEPIMLSGFSYGTILGATLAAMQPHRVKRFLLDGVGDSEAYYAGDIFPDLSDADAPVKKLFEYCALAGEKVCPLWNGETASDTEARLQAIFDDFRANGSIPVPGSLESGLGPTLVTLSDVKIFLNTLMFDSRKSFPSVAALLAPLTNRNGSAIARRKSAIYSPPIGFDNLPDAYDPMNPSTAKDLYESQFYMINGGDATLRLTRDEFKDQVWKPLHDNVNGTSKWMADYQAGSWMFQYTWPDIFAWRFGDKTPVRSDVTANPILWASSAHDGITSLSSAKSARERFKGSGLVISDGEAHSAAGSPSLCLAKVFRRYFQTGEVSDEEVVCTPTRRPFDLKPPLVKTETLLADPTLEEKVLLELFVGIKMK